MFFLVTRGFIAKAKFLFEGASKEHWESAGCRMQEPKSLSAISLFFTATVAYVLLYICDYTKVFFSFRLVEGDTVICLTPVWACNCSHNVLRPHFMPLVWRYSGDWAGIRCRCCSCYCKAREAFRMYHYGFIKPTTMWKMFLSCPKYVSWSLIGQWGRQSITGKIRVKITYRSVITWGRGCFSWAGGSANHSYLHTSPSFQLADSLCCCAEKKVLVQSW